MKTLKEQKWMLIIYAVTMIVVGALEFILSIVDIGAAIKVVSYALGCGLILVGVLHIITSLIADTKAFFKGALVLGSIEIAAGIVLFIRPQLISGFLIIFVATLALALGAVMLAKAIIAIIYKYKGGWIFLYFLFATLAIVFGILALVYEAKFTQAIYCATGAFLFAFGIFLLVYGIKSLTGKKEEPKE